MAGNTDFLYDVVTNRIIAALEAGTVPWRKPWDPTTGFPRSTSTKSPYHGINVLLLGASWTRVRALALGHPGAPAADPAEPGKTRPAEAR